MQVQENDGGARQQWCQNAFSLPDPKQRYLSFPSVKGKAVGGAGGHLLPYA